MDWPVVVYAGAFATVVGSAGLLWAGVRRMVRFEDTVAEVPEIKKQLAAHVESEKKLVADLGPVLQQIRVAVTEVQGGLKSVEQRLHEHTVTLARTDQQLQSLGHQFGTHEAKDEARFAEERDDRHDLRAHLDGRLRTIETDVARMQGGRERKPRGEMA